MRRTTTDHKALGPALLLNVLAGFLCCYPADASEEAALFDPAYESIKPRVSNARVHGIKVIRGQEELCVKRQEVLNVIRALDGLYRSAQEGREVRFD